MSGTTDGVEETNRAQVGISLTGQETTALVDCVQTWRYRVDSRQHGFFLAKKVRAASKQPSKEVLFAGTSGEIDAEEDIRPTTPGTPGQSLGFSWVIESLASFEAGFFDNTHPNDRFVCFTDPSTYSTYPGWMLRNLLVLIRQRWHLDAVQVLCYRDIRARRHEARSIVLILKLDNQRMRDTAYETGTNEPPTMPKVTGWERNGAGKITSKVASLGEYMDPQRYALYTINVAESEL